VFHLAGVLTPLQSLENRKEDLVKQNMDDLSCDHNEDRAIPHAGPGIMLLTASMKLLYKDRRAWELCQQIIRCRDGKTANGVLPPVVVSLVTQIRKILKVRIDPREWEQLRVQRIVDTIHSSVLLCGTALIDQTSAEKRILIVISEVGIGTWQDTVIVHAKEQFQLTKREATVIQHLLKGWTNKEIANEMSVAEQTIKVHFKHITRKTSTTTRTGIVMKIIHSGLRHALAPPTPHMTVPSVREMPIELAVSA